MINVNQITSTLARMQLPELQQYAALHKNDPYIVSLAMSVANQKKQAEVAKNGMAGMQPQPKVVDQQIAQMVAPQMPPQQQMPQGQPQMPPQQAQQRLPEDSGIGQLPAQNMQGMADGGIVGYADTGLVKTYAINESITDPATGRTYTPAEINELLKTNPKATMDMIHKQSFVQNPPVFPKGNPGIQYGAPTDPMQQKFSGSQTGGNILPTTTGYEGRTIGQVLSGIGRRLNFDPLAPTKVRETTYQSGLDVGGPGSSPMNTGRVPTADELKAAQLAAAGNNPMGNTVTFAPQDGGGSPTSKPPAKPSAGANAGRPAGGIDALQRENDAIARLKSNAVGGAETEINKTDFLNEANAISKPAYDKANAMIEKEKGRLKEGKDQDFYMALIEGGLAAAGETGPNGLQNLAKGFSKGAASYRDALKDFRKATQENAKMEVDLSRAEAAEKVGNLKTYYERMDKYQDRKLKRDDNINQGIAQIINTSVQGQNQKDVAHISGGYHVASSRASANAQRELMEALGNAEPDSALRKGFDLQKTIAQQAALYEQYQKMLMDPTTGMERPDVRKMYPNFQTYLAEYEKAIANKGAPGGGIKTIADPSKTQQPVMQR
jgi:hypothetical protein